MLIEFTIGNFRSIREPQTLSMLAGKTGAKGTNDKRLDEKNIFEINGIQLLKTAALYGANSSGKSNIIKGLSFMRRQIRQLRLRRNFDIEDREDRVGGVAVEPFLLDSKSSVSPSHFEVIFFTNGKQYRYGFNTTQERIVAEWLYHVPEQRESLLFKREEDSYDLRGVFKKEGANLQERTRENQLFLTVVAEFNGHTAREVMDWFALLRIDSGLRRMERPRLTEKFLSDDYQNSPERQLVLNLLRNLNLGFDDVSIEREQGFAKRSTLLLATAQSAVLGEANETNQTESTAPLRRVRFETVRTRTVHRSNDTEQTIMFDLADQESDGTQRIFALAGEIVDVLSRGGVMIVDEMDARLHPILTRNLVQLFNSIQVNPHNAQLFFATHDTNLLTNRLFRRDQIWFVEKDQQQASQFYSLAEFKNVRKDASFEKDYILGRYGAIPFLGDLRDMLDPLQPDQDLKVTADE